MKTRQPYVANQFYPGSAPEIISMLDEISLKEDVQTDKSVLNANILGGIVPHAGYAYSGYQAVHFLEYLKKTSTRFDTVFLIFPDHQGLGSSVALDGNDSWITPMGKVQVDKDFYGYLDLPEDNLPHQYEHSGEVILPMLQHFLQYEFKLVPIAVSNQNPENARLAANSIVKANNILKKKILVIASSDFSHYVQPEHGEEQDKEVIDAIKKFDVNGVYHEVRRKNVSVCGYGPIMTLLEYAKIVTQTPNIKLLKRGHSGEVHSSRQVVFYTSFIVYE